VLGLLGAASLAAGATIAAPGTAGSAAAATQTQNPDQLFQEGWFARAERGYRRLLHKDPDHAHAAAQVGYIALLSNRFGDAERFLTKAITLAPGEVPSKQRLADCYVRQDQHARAVPVLRTIGTESSKAYADLYAALRGAPWQVHGAQSTRVPFVGIDPLPFIEASVQGGAPRKFYLDTGATLALSEQAAKEADLVAVSSSTGKIGGGATITLYHGIMDSFRLGGIELRNVPVTWHRGPMPNLPDGSQPAGAIGTTTFYHLLATMDYAGQALVLRRKTRDHLRAFQAQARRAGAEKLPLWIGRDHFPCTLGSLRDYGPRVVTLDTGGTGIGIVMSEAMAKKVGIELDEANKDKFNGIDVYRIFPDRISLGDAVGRNVRGIAGPLSVGNLEFDTIANFTHTFFKPFAITFDYTDMNLYITGKSVRAAS
jgi:hypothetical protein